VLATTIFKRKSNKCAKTLKSDYLKLKKIYLKVYKMNIYNIIFQKSFKLKRLKHEE